MKASQKWFYAFLVLIFIGSMGCRSSQPNTNRSENIAGNIKTVAVVSFAVNNYGAAFGQGAIDPYLIKSEMTNLLIGTEKTLCNYFKVVKASSFIGKDTYYDLSIGHTRKGLFSPVFKNRSMPTFVTERNDVVKGNLAPQTAVNLCKALKVDGVMLFYTEWTLDSGKFIPTIKALTKNCISMYNSQGKKLFYQRKDVRGDKVIGGAFAGVHVNEDTIHHWVDASLKGIQIIFSKVKI